MRTKILIAVIVFGLALFWQCSSSTGPEDSADTELQRLLDQTPRVDREAELAALWLSGDLVAPESLYLQIRDAYSQVRSEYHSMFLIERRIAFKMREYDGWVSLDLSPEGVALIRAGTFIEFDSLNELLHAIKIDTADISDEDYPQVDVDFEGRLHPDRLREMYSALEGVTNVDIPHLIDPISNFYPWYVDGRLAFLLYSPGYPGYISFKYEQYYYFKPDSARYDFIGMFEPRDGILPDWWDEIKYARCKFMGLDDTACDSYDWLFQYRSSR